MISHPSSATSPRSRRRCQELGVAMPLVGEVGAPVTPETVRSALEQVVAQRDALSAKVDTARAWELRTIAGRDAVVDRVLALVGRAT